MFRSALSRARRAAPLRRCLHEDSLQRGGKLVGIDMSHAPGYEVAADDDPPPASHTQKLADFAARHAQLSSAQVGDGVGYLWMGNVLYPSGLAPDGEAAFSWELADEEEEEEDEEDGKRERESDIEVVIAASAPQVDTEMKVEEEKETQLKQSQEAQEAPQLQQAVHDVEYVESDDEDCKVKDADDAVVGDQVVQHDQNEVLDPIADTAAPMRASRRYTGGQARRIRKLRERNKRIHENKPRPSRPIRKPHNDVPPEDQ